MIPKALRFGSLLGDDSPQAVLAAVYSVNSASGSPSFRALVRLLQWGHSEGVATVMLLGMAFAWGGGLSPLQTLQKEYLVPGTVLGEFPPAIIYAVRTLIK